jgi:hypothetical protein
VEEKVDIAFVPRDVLELPRSGTEDELEPREVKWDDPEPLVDGKIDLGALATEFLILGLDPYPRKPGAVFDPPPEERSGDGPFAGLAKLKG